MHVNIKNLLFFTTKNSQSVCSFRLLYNIFSIEIRRLKEKLNIAERNTNYFLVYGRR